LILMVWCRATIYANAKENKEKLILQKIILYDEHKVHVFP
jgi:hypothetical protein